MQDRLEEEEEPPHSDLQSSFDTSNSSTRLFPDNPELQTNNEMGQSQNEPRQEVAGSMRTQYLVSLAAVLGGMTMGTTIGNNAFNKLMLNILVQSHKLTLFHKLLN